MMDVEVSKENTVADKLIERKRGENRGKRIKALSKVKLVEKHK